MKLSLNEFHDVIESTIKGFTYSSEHVRRDIITVCELIHYIVAHASHLLQILSNHIGWEFVGVYADEGISGTKDSRPEFQRLLADCRKSMIDLVITKSITRFARNTVTLLDAIRELKLLNIDVFFEKENLHSLSANGELMLTLLARSTLTFEFKDNSKIEVAIQP